MPKEFKLTRPLDMPVELRRARREAVQADRATSELSDVRQKLGDASYQVEQILREAGREP